MSVKANGQRIFILVIVVVFFLTSLGATGFVVYDALINKDNQEAATSTDELQQQLQEQNEKEGKLEGTQLQGFTPIPSVNELQKIDTTPGNGTEAQAGSTITAHYTGAVAATGMIFQSSKDTGEPFTSALDGLIPGWQEGIPGMKVGGVRRLVIPAEKAYGATPPPGSNIPANAALVFDIELIAVQ